MSTEDAPLVLDVRGLKASYGATPILQGVDLSVHKGEIVSLIGRNGVGKTTTMRCLMGLLRTRGGSVQLRGRDIAALPSDARARLGIGYVPQGREVFPCMTVAENLTVGELVGGPRGKSERPVQRS
ncbi:ATP-binding cassette domain-containing protein [Variovorax sp. efr-133-TYG-130]|uniref:ATP-binding cassette domain-containing protein n=1 Tax=Variovorax sp. efr-133-TYG-130 TaxID=3040327 RepID=UPI002552A25A|nr:ATP-binding cassette domain-containing protein [Variovorax sp. efr-133-TYG-130]